MTNFKYVVFENYNMPIRKAVATFRDEAYANDFMDYYETLNTSFAVYDFTLVLVKSDEEHIYLRSCTWQLS